MKYDSTSLKLPIENLEAEDYLPLNGTDYIEFYVGNAKQAAHFFKSAFGFQDHAYSGLETGSKEKTSYVLKQNLVLCWSVICKCFLILPEIDLCLTIRLFLRGNIA